MPPARPGRAGRPSLLDEQLRALLAVLDEGSFEGGAFALGISPSAMSQRIKALESRIGQIVVRRTSPPVATPAGAVLVRAARQMELVEADAVAELAGSGGAARLAVAVNADSLATWFPPVLVAAATWEDSTLDLAVEDQDHSATLLRDGEVLAAVTSQAAPVAGCVVEPLGAMRYLPVAAPSLLDRCRRGGAVDLAALPVLRFDAKDDLQRAALLRAGADPSRPRAHVVPSSEGFVAAVRAGLGWGMVPEAQLGGDLEAGRLVPLPGVRPVDVPLHWQAWRLASPRLEELSRTVRSAAAGLRPVAAAT